jgi:hypothetical protein
LRSENRHCFTVSPYRFSQRASSASSTWKFSRLAHGAVPLVGAQTQCVFASSPENPVDILIATARSLHRIGISRRRRRGAHAASVPQTSPRFVARSRPVRFSSLPFTCAFLQRASSLQIIVRVVGWGCCYINQCAPIARPVTSNIAPTPPHVHVVFAS